MNPVQQQRAIVPVHIITQGQSSTRKTATVSITSLQVLDTFFAKHRRSSFHFFTKLTDQILKVILVLGDVLSTQRHR